MKTTESGVLRVLLPFAFIFFIFSIIYNINWGAPFYFHPDERNIATSVSQLKFPQNLNPHFFAYGSLPIYCVYFLGVLINFISGNHTALFNVDFSQAIILGRIFSATLTVFLVFLIYKTTYKICGKEPALLAVIISCTSVGFLQFSHYGTFEIWISLFSLLMSYLLFLFLKNNKLKYYLLASVVFGLLCALKISSFPLLILPVYVIFIKLKENKKPRTLLKLFFAFIFVSTAAYLISAPYNILDTTGFLSSMKYESSVGLGALPVFYTGAFFNTLPIIFQYQNILPFLLNPLLTLISIPALIFVFLNAVKKRDTDMGILLISFFVLFISGSFVFSKWTRYIVPVLPFFYIFISFFVYQVIKKNTGKKFTYILVILISVSFIFSISYVKTVRVASDTRLAAVDFANKNVKSDSVILSEVYDLGILPFNNSFTRITLFNFYDLDENPAKKRELGELVKKSEYIVLPSPRVLRSRLNNERHFPKGFKFYSDLFSGKLGYKKIYETPCDIYCRIIYLGDPIYNLEETVNVFDRPTVYIFKK